MRELIKSKICWSRKKSLRSMTVLALLLLIKRTINTVTNTHLFFPPNVGEALIEMDIVASFDENPFESDDLTSSNINISNNFFSGCLLTKDDNHKLVEWLAYHHYVLPLQHLVVAVDPQSITSPTALFDRWRLRGMIIEQWADEDFMPPEEFEWSISNSSEIRTHAGQYHLHRRRQNRFLGQCLRYLKSQNRTWTLLIDTDEYLQFNGPAGRTNHNVTKVAYRTLRERGAVLKFLVELDQHNKTKPCIQIPRTNFGNVETVNDTKEIPQISGGIFLDTMRYRKHGQRDSGGMTKPLIDLSKVQMENIEQSVKSSHKPLKICGKKKTADKDAVLRINHYLGSWESFSFRKDARGPDLTLENYNYKTEDTKDELSDDNIRPWIDGFIDSHSEHEFSALLGGAGVLPDKE